MEARDVFLQGSCDEVCMELIEELGWTSDLVESVLAKAHCADTDAAADVGGASAGAGEAKQPCLSKNKKGVAAQRRRGRGSEQMRQGLTKCARLAMAPASADLLLAAAIA